MELSLIKLVVRTLRKKADDLEVGNTNLTSEEAMDIFSVLTHESMSKSQACRFLNVLRSRFAELIEEGVIPRGRKVEGFKELRWYKDELFKAIRKNRK